MMSQSQPSAAPAADYRALLGAELAAARQGQQLESLRTLAERAYGAFKATGEPGYLELSDDADHAIFRLQHERARRAGATPAKRGGPNPLWASNDDPGAPAWSR